MSAGIGGNIRNCHRDLISDKRYNSEQVASLQERLIPRISDRYRRHPTGTQLCVLCRVSRVSLPRGCVEN